MSRGATSLVTSPEMRAMLKSFGEDESGNVCGDCRWFANLFKRDGKVVYRCVAHDALFPDKAAKHKRPLWFGNSNACGIFAERLRTMSTTKRYVVDRPKHRDIIRIVKDGDAVKFTRIDDRWKGKAVTDPFIEQYDFRSRTYKLDARTEPLLCAALGKFIAADEVVVYPHPGGWVAVPTYNTPDDYKDIP